MITFLFSLPPIIAQVSTVYDRRTVITNIRILANTLVKITNRASNARVEAIRSAIGKLQQKTKEEAHIIAKRMQPLLAKLEILKCSAGLVAQKLNKLINFK